MIDTDDPETLLEIDHAAKNLSALADGPRLERAIAQIHKRAEALLIARGASDVEAFFHADAIVMRLRGLIAHHRRRRDRSRGDGQKSMPEGTAHRPGSEIFTRSK